VNLVNVPWNRDGEAVADFASELRMENRLTESQLVSSLSHFETYSCFEEDGPSLGTREESACCLKVEMERLSLVFEISFQVKLRF
jgi:hypothetical protein